MPKRGQPGYRKWLPPQRGPGATTRSYTATLNKTINSLQRFIDDEHNSERMREQWKRRQETCRDEIQRVTLEDI